MSNQLSTLKQQINSESFHDQLKKALPSHLSPERQARICITALTKTPKLAECTPESFFQCLLDLSAAGLEPDGRRAHLIPYGKVCTLILDYKGIVELMRRSGDVVRIHSDVVCQNDTFAHNKGEITNHTYDLQNPRGEMYAAYTEVTFKDGSTQSAIMSKEEVDAIRNRSKSGQNGPWKTDYNEMAKKTTIRRVSKLVTLSPEVAHVIELDQNREFPSVRNVTPRGQVQLRGEALLAKREIEGDQEGGES